MMSNWQIPLHINWDLCGSLTLLHLSIQNKAIMTAETEGMSLR